MGLSGLLIAASARACERDGRMVIGAALDLRRRLARSPGNELSFCVSMIDVALDVPALSEAAIWSVAAEATRALGSEACAGAQALGLALAIDRLSPIAAGLLAVDRTILGHTFLFSNIGDCSDLLGSSGAALHACGFTTSPRASRRLQVSCASIGGRLSLSLAFPADAANRARVERFSRVLAETLALLAR